MKRYSKTKGKRGKGALRIAAPDRKELQPKGPKLAQLYVFCQYLVQPGIKMKTCNFMQIYG
ncbi:hypothetical protein DLB09_18810 [Salmonella enterica subsp. salamae]|nr:hypothetical protein [Salmonella enterica subsp. salamae]